MGSHFGVGALPILVHFSGDRDVHWGYGILTHGHIADVVKIAFLFLCRTLSRLLGCSAGTGVLIPPILRRSWTVGRRNMQFVKSIAKLEQAFVHRVSFFEGAKRTPSVWGGASQ